MIKPPKISFTRCGLPETGVENARHWVSGCFLAVRKQRAGESWWWQCLLLVLIFCTSVSASETETSVTSDPDVKKESEGTVRRPFLWKIEKADPAGDSETAASWIFGTIHVPDEEVTTLHPLVQSAFDGANAAYFEIDFIKSTDAQTKAISLPEGESLDELISSELIDRLDLRLKKLSPMFARARMPDVQVGVWPLLLGNLQAQARHPGQMPLDMRLYFSATQRRKRIGGLESPDDQLRGITGLTIEEQTEFLKATLDGMDNDDNEGVDRIEEILDVYSEGDSTKFETLFEEEFQRIGLSRGLTDKILSGLLYDRNRVMAETADELMKKHPQDSYFFAVGLGHLTGKHTVQEFLQARGYRIERETEQ